MKARTLGAQQVRVPHLDLVQVCEHARSGG
jgi:hypothetical protein